MPRFASWAAPVCLFAAGAAPLLRAAESTDAELARIFEQSVVPFVRTYCTGCHGGAAPAASFDLQPYRTVDAVVHDLPRWSLVQAKLAAREMPPRGAKQPPEELRQQVAGWAGALRRREARRNAGDPGAVTARRLSNSEYNYTIRDLTGADLKPAREFPVDPANQAGFDNSGESLRTSPALLAKYLDAAREVADHLVLKPDGFTFATHPMRVETDREKYPIERIVRFYDAQPTDFADYFEAAWRYRHRAATKQPNATLAAVATEMKISPRYLTTVWQALEQKEGAGPLAKLQAMWAALPAAGSERAAVRAGCERMRDFVVRIRRHTERLYTEIEAPGFNANFQPIAMFRNRQVAAHRRDFDPAWLRVEGEPARQGFLVTRGPTFGKGEAEELKVKAAQYLEEMQSDPDLAIPAAERARYEAAFARFSAVFPTAFCLRERGRFYPITSMDKGRLLGAGLHNVMGYFRDDQPLIEMILDEKGKRELETLWQEFEFIADYTTRTYAQFVFNGGEGRGNDIRRPSPNQFATEAEILRLRDEFAARAQRTANAAIVQAVKDYFELTNARIRWVEQARRDAEPRHREALLKFAERAYRRPLAEDEREEILAYYRELREQRSLTHEEAVRGSIAAILVSPDFLYRVDLRGGRAETAARYVPLAAYSLASRLSYFLWSSMPDEELLAHAGAGDLARSTVLAAQVRRMLKDPRARALATEFGGSWLDFRRFEGHNGVDRARFPVFTNELRQAMFEEPVRLLEDVIRNDRPVLDLLYGKYTFVNRVLAEHYGMPVPAVAGEAWFRVDDAGAYGRGGLLPMAVFLTQNAPGLRTSPVKRGYWVARRVLGEVIPPPPAAVPELPGDEAKSDLPVRDLLAKHRENSMCASCHARFDSFGLALEGFGPVGERRSKDLAGRAVDARATFPGGEAGAGLEGLRNYIHTRREKDFLNNLGEKLLAYGLCRSTAITDEPLLDAMQAKLAASGGATMASLVEAIVTSPQFLNRRNPGYSQTGNPALSQQKGK